MIRIPEYLERRATAGGTGAAGHAGHGGGGSASEAGR